MSSNMSNNELASNRTLFVLNQNFVQFYAISEFVSLIWTERYWEFGDFELEVLYDLDILDNVKVGHYVTLGDSPNIMIIDSISITYEIDNKASRYIIYKGRTLESILQRRIVWGEWLYEDVDMQSIIFDILEKAITAPEDEGRRIPFFRLKTNSDIPEEKLTLYGDGDVVYDIVHAICQEKQLGMKCELIENAKVVEFSLYFGEDHSYDQLERAPVIFSSEYENLGPSRYSLDTTKFKTVALAVSPWRDTNVYDEEGNVVDTETTRSMVEVGDFSVKGLNRREVFVSCGSGYPDDMVQEAMEEIADANQLEELDSELDPKRQFVYGRDYTIGDTVQVVTEFGLDAKAIVIEFIRSWSADGYTEVPTFKIIEGSNHILSGDEEADDGKEPEKPPEPLFIDIPTVVSTLVYNGDYQEVKLSNYNSEHVYLAGTTRAINAGYYLVYAILRDPNNFWSDYTTEPKLIGWTIEGVECAVPTFVQGSFDYTGQSITPVLNGFIPELMIITGTTTATRPGEYTIGIVLDPNCQWPDGTNGIKYLVWKINKGVGSITLLDSNDVVLNDETIDVMVPFIFSGGQPVISIVDSNIVSAEIVESDRAFYIRIIGLTYGESDIHLHTEENELYLESKDTVIHVVSKVGWMEAGIDWVEVDTEVSGLWRSVAYGHGRFVAVSSGYGRIILYSDDGGEHWNQASLPFSLSFNSVVYGDGMFVAPEADRGSRYVYSYNGIDWMVGSLGFREDWRAIAHGNGRFVLLASNKDYGIFSDDGINWTKFDLPVSFNWYSMVYANGRFVAVANSSAYCIYSDDGTNWESASMPSSGNYYSVGYVEGKFISFLGANAFFAYSDDGINWTERTAGVPPTRGNRYQMAYGNEYLAALNSDTPYVQLSKNGVDWDYAVLPSSRNWYGLAYGGGRFVGIAYNSSYVVYSGMFEKELEKDWTETDMSENGAYSGPLLN